jgi:hypothetical protein
MPFVIAIGLVKVSSNHFDKKGVTSFDASQQSPDSASSAN